MADPASMADADVAVWRCPSGDRAKDAVGSRAVSAGDGWFVVVEVGRQLGPGTQVVQVFLELARVQVVGDGEAADVGTQGFRGKRRRGDGQPSDGWTRPGDLCV